MTDQIRSNGSPPLSNATFGSGDSLTVNAGATATGISFHGGTGTIFGTISASTVDDGGSLAISSGSATDTIIASGGQFLVVSAGSAFATTVENGGTAVIEAVASGLTVASGGFAVVEDNATELDDFSFLSTATVASGGALVILSGTTANTLTVASGGTILIAPGATNLGPVSGPGTVITGGIALIGANGSINSQSATASGLDIGRGAQEMILPGGSAISAIVRGGSQQIFSGGTASGTLLSAGDQVVNSGATALATVVDSGAATYVFSGGVTTDAIIDGGLDIVDLGGTATSDVIDSGGQEAVDGTVIGTTLNGGGEYVVGSGVALGTVIGSGGYAYVSGTAINTVIAGGYEVVSGGLAINTTISGGTLFAYSGTSAIDTTVSSGGIELVLSGATDSGTVVESGGTYIALSGASVTGPAYVNGATIVSGGVVLTSGPISVTHSESFNSTLILTSGMSSYVLSTGGEDGITIGNSGLSVVYAGGAASGTVIQGGGELKVASGGTAEDTIIQSGGELDIKTGGSAGAIVFSGAGGIFAFSGHALPGAVVSGFASGDTIDFNAISGGASVATLLSGNVLQVSGGGHSAQLQLASSFSGGTLETSETATGGTAVTIAAAPAAGTGTTTSGDADPVHLPLYIEPFENGGYKIGIELSLDGGSSYHLYEFDTGAAGLYAAYSPAWWSSYSVDAQAPATNVYASGNTYTAQVVSTNVTFKTVDGSALSLDGAKVGLIDTASNGTTFTPQQWNTDLTDTAASPPLDDNFYGDFGMGLGTKDGLSALLPQLSGNLSNGFIVTLGDYPNGINGQIGDVQVGLTQADIAGFTTVIKMQGQNTLDPYANSEQPTYTKILGDGALTVSNSVNNPGSMPSGFVFDTGAPTTDIHEGSVITSSYLSSFLDSTGKSVNSGTTVSLAAAGDGPWGLTITSAGPSKGLDAVQVNDADSGLGYVNTGLNAFFGERIMFDVADGLIGFESLSCFAAGTRIETPKGEVAVESLRVGDTVTTVSGAARPILWIGHRQVDCRRHPAPETVRPVRVGAGAFGAGLPRRDLFLSPDHAVFLEDALIPVRYLIDEDVISQVYRSTITYYHIELAQHDVILAEGLPAETYLETGHRSAFANGGSVVQAWPDFTPPEPESFIFWDVLGYAPLTVTGDPLERAQARLRTHSRRPHAQFKIGS